MVHKISLESIAQDRHTSRPHSRVFNLLNGHGFGLFPTGTGRAGGNGGGYAVVSGRGFEEEDETGYRFGGRRGRGLTGGTGKMKTFTSRSTRNTLLVILAIGLSFLLGRYTTTSRASTPHPSPPFLIPPSLFPGLSPSDIQSLTPCTTDRSLYPSPRPPAKGQLVPNVVHYVYGLKETGREDGKGDEFPYYAYLAVRSALVNIRPERIYFHYHNIPTGPWWDALLPELTLIRHEHVLTHVMGKELKHFAHKSDVIRLEALINSGGIYLDIDVFVTRPFEPLMYHPTTLGMEASPDSRRTALQPEGLCNGVIIAQNGSEFLKRWRAMYETFDEGNWAGHSVVMPWKLARKYREEVQVLGTRAFFWPMWHGEEIKKVHELDDYDFAASGQFGYHAWESLAMGYLGELSPYKIRTVESSFNRMVRPFLGDGDDLIFHAWREGKT